MKRMILGERTRNQIGETFGPWSHGIEAKGRLIFIAGQIALFNRKVIGKGDIGAQYEHILKNIKAVLEDADASIHDVVKLVHYVVPNVTPESAEYKSLVEVRKQYFKGESYPVSTLVRVAGLMVEDCLIEVDAIAVAD